MSWQASLGVGWTAASRGPWRSPCTEPTSNRAHITWRTRSRGGSTCGTPRPARMTLSSTTRPPTSWSTVSPPTRWASACSGATTACPRRFTTELRACLTPLYVSDSDDHKLRDQARDCLWLCGLGAAVDARVIFHFQKKVGTSTPYLALGGGLSFFAVPTTETQYWYGDADAANGAPQGTLITGVGDHHPRHAIPARRRDGVCLLAPRLARGHRPAPGGTAGRNRPGEAALHTGA